MDVDELVQRYTAGERDFTGVNLTGANLSGINLSGANFTQAFLPFTTLDRSLLAGACLKGTFL